MVRLLSILFLFVIVSCNQNASQAEKDYIKNLEEKNKVLEKELLEAKGNSDPSKTVQGHKQNTKVTTDFFTIGSTEDDVIEVMGEPTSYIKTAPEAKKFHYGLSTIYFYQGKVISYDNLDDNLKVRVKK